ncbi:MAG TPA: hypothetical protein VGE41_09950 [Verrucomicrobiae bacterium]|jgi:flagellar export protein FliJ
MKGFKFTLEGLLTLREREEQDALTEYGASLRRLDEARQTASAAQRELELAQAELQELFLKSAPAGRLSQMQDYCQMMEKKKRECDYALKVAQNKSHQSFLKLVSSRQAKGVVEKCLQNQKKQYAQQRRKFEQKQSDELVNQGQLVAGILNGGKDKFLN